MSCPSVALDLKEVSAIQKQVERLERQLEQKARGSSGGCVLAASWLTREAPGRSR